MRVVMADGRQFDGTPDRIVRSMARGAFYTNRPMSMLEYVNYVVESTESIAGIQLDLDLPGMAFQTPPDDVLASALIDALAHEGLARVLTGPEHEIDVRSKHITPHNPWEVVCSRLLLAALLHEVFEGVGGTKQDAPRGPQITVTDIVARAITRRPESINPYWYDLVDAIARPK